MNITMKGDCIIFVLIILCFVPVTLAGIASTWFSCDCIWAAWMSWSECSASCGGGTRVRNRRVWHLAIPRCNGFAKCASNDLGIERKVCNTYCYNNGIYVHSRGGYCRCFKGKKGSCCEQTVTCGRPNSISHGTFIGTTFTYSGRITYHCDKDYNMTDSSDSVRTCTSDGSWSGRSPICMYAASCNSNPCKNGATCVNLLGDFRCVCQQGWAEKICDFDIQSPVVTGCPTNRTIFTSNMTSMQTWNDPIITDPHNTDVKVTRNYPTTSYEFPWGEFIVQYSAVKPSNGLKSECLFAVAVKPHPCQTLVAPENGMVVCNNWRMEYARVCTYSCFVGFVLPPGFTGTMFSCGATGNWLPSRPLEQCLPEMLFGNDKNESKDEIKTFATCEKPDDREKIANFYINALLSSEFNSLCLNHINECISDNVDIIC